MNCYQTDGMSCSRKRKQFFRYFDLDLLQVHGLVRCFNCFIYIFQVLFAHHFKYQRTALIDNSDVLRAKKNQYQFDQIL